VHVLVCRLSEIGMHPSGSVKYAVSDYPSSC